MLTPALLNLSLFIVMCMNLKSPTEIEALHKEKHDLT